MIYIIPYRKRDLFRVVFGLDYTFPCIRCLYKDSSCAVVEFDGIVIKLEYLFGGLIEFDERILLSKSLEERFDMFFHIYMLLR